MSQTTSTIATILLCVACTAIVTRFGDGRFVIGVTMGIGIGIGLGYMIGFLRRGEMERTDDQPAWLNPKEGDR